MSYWNKKEAESNKSVWTPRSMDDMRRGQFDAIMSFFKSFEKKFGRKPNPSNPEDQELTRKFYEALESKSYIVSDSDEDIEALEAKANELAIRYCKRYKMDPSNVKIILTPGNIHEAKMDGGNPVRIYIAMSPSNPDFESLLGNCIKQAPKLLKSYSLVSTRVLAKWNNENKKLIKLSPNTDQDNRDNYFHSLIPGKQILVRRTVTYELKDEVSGVVYTQLDDNNLWELYNSQRPSPHLHELRTKLTRKVYAELISNSSTNNPSDKHDLEHSGGNPEAEALEGTEQGVNEVESEIESFLTNIPDEDIYNTLPNDEDEL